jgi:hypothetical protein
MWQSDARAEPYIGEPDYDGYLKSFEDWKVKIVNLLNHHQIQLPDQDEQLWVGLRDKTHGRVFWGVMRRIPDDQAGTC